MIIDGCAVDKDNAWLLTTDQEEEEGAGWILYYYDGKKWKVDCRSGELEAHTLWWPDDLSISASGTDNVWMTANGVVYQGRLKNKK